MAKYRLTAKHYWRDQLLEAGTLVGDDTPHPVPPEGPTYDMEPLDDEAKAKIEELLETKTKTLAAAPQLGLLYLQPDTQEAVNKLIAAQTPKTQTPLKSPTPTSTPTPASTHTPTPTPKPEVKGK